MGRITTRNSGLIAALGENKMTNYVAAVSTIDNEVMELVTNDMETAGLFIKKYVGRIPSQINETVVSMDGVCKGLIYIEMDI